MQIVVIPTRLELERVLASDSAAVRLLRSGLEPGAELETHVCGFGAIGAATYLAERLAQRLATGAVESVTLLGLAGTYEPERCPIGGAHVATACQLAEAGAGSGDERVDLATLGFPLASVDGVPVFDRLLCIRGEAPAPPGADVAFLSGAVHLTVHSASGSISQAEARFERHPHACIEEMEGFGVALACARAKVPLTMIRGVSNRAGDRDVAHWQIEPALLAATDAWLELRENSA